MEITKTCSRCNREKPLNAFHRHPTASFGRKHHCKSCCRETGRELYDRMLRASGLSRRAKLGGIVSECNHKRGDVRADGAVFHSRRKTIDGRFKEWWVTKEHFDAICKNTKDRCRFRYHNDPKYREKQRKKNTSSASKERKRSWNRQNRDYLDAYFGARRAKMKIGHLSPEDRKHVVEFYKFRDILNKVHGKAMFHVDHIVPIAAGGKHEPDNLQIATAAYNVRKFKNPDPIRGKRERVLAGY